MRIPSVNSRFEVGDGINREADVQRVVAPRLEAAGMTVDSYDIFPSRPNARGHASGSDRWSQLSSRGSPPSATMPTTLARVSHPLIHGPSGAGLHGPDERVDVDSLVEAAQTFASAAIECCGLE